MGAEQVIRRTRDFRRVYSRGRSLHLEGLVVCVAPREDANLPARLGLAVAPPANAVVRNRVKRRLRAAFAQCGATGVDVVIRAQRAVVGMPFQDLAARLCAALRRAGAES